MQILLLSLHVKNDISDQKVKHFRIVITLVFFRISLMNLVIEIGNCGCGIN